MKKLILVLFLSCCCFNAAWAIKVPNLYQQSITVANQSDAVRTAAFNQAFRMELVKVSGDSKAATLADGVKNSASYITGYSYQGNNILVNFQADAINKFLLDAGQTIWQAERPSVLIWMLLEDSHGKRLVGSGSNEAMLNAVQILAQQRGIPLTFPLADFADLNRISLNDIATNNMAAIKSASRRYTYDVLVVAQLMQNPDNSWVGQLSLTTDAEPQLWQVSVKDTNQFISLSLNTVFDTLAQQYRVIKTSTQSVVTMAVTNVNDMQSYGALLTYLRSLDQVKSVKIQNVKGSQVNLLITINGTPDDLQKVLKLSNHLIAQSQNGSQLIYTWQP